MTAKEGAKDVVLREIPKWESHNIISSEQGKKIRALYKAGEEEGVGGKLVPFIAIFGSLMIGAGIILFFAMNWSTIPKAVKVFSLLGFLLAFYHLGYLMKFSKGTFPKVGEALIFLGAVLFGANIALIGQIFNISAHWPNMFLFWALGALAIAYCAASLTSLYVGLITLLIYVGTESLYWFEKIDSFYHAEYAFFLIFLSLGVLYFTVGSLHEKKDSARTMRYPYHLIGSSLILMACYLLSFKWFGEGFGRYSGSNDLLFTSQFWAILLFTSAICAIALIYHFMTRKKGEVLEFYEVFILALLLVFSPAVVLLAKVNYWFVPVLFNIILFLLIVASVYLGHEKREKTLVNLGMAAFGVALVSRYFEYLWDVLNGYLFFIIGGFLLIGLSIILEKKRRSILRDFA